MRRSYSADLYGNIFTHVFIHNILVRYISGISWIFNYVRG